MIFHIHACLQPPAVVGQQEGPAAQVIDRDRHGQFERLTDLPLLHEDRHLHVRPMSTLFHVICLLVEDVLTPK